MQSRLFSLASAAGFALAGISGQALASAYQNENEIYSHVERQLADYGVNEQVSEIGVFERYSVGSEGDKVIGYSAWVRLSGCSGHLVMELSLHGFVRHAYTTDDCHVDGVALQ